MDKLKLISTSFAEEIGGVTTYASVATASVNFDLSLTHHVTSTGHTSNNIALSGGHDGDTRYLIVECTSTGYNFTGTPIKWPSDVTPTPSSATKIDAYSFVKKGEYYYGTYALGYVTAAAVPVYWSKLDSSGGITTGEIGTATLTGDTASFTTGKWGNSLYYDGTGFKDIYITPASMIATRGTFSGWFKSYASSGEYIGDMSCVLNSSGAFTGAGLYLSDGASNVLAYITINDTNVSTEVLTDKHDWYHIYVVWSTAGNLGSGNKYIRLWVDGGLKCETTTSFTAGTGKVWYRSGVNTNPDRLYADNIKIWDTCIEDPSAEYNSGTGRESYQ